MSRKECVEEKEKTLATNLLKWSVYTIFLTNLLSVVCRKHKYR
jgi:hypothetical protein